MVHEKALAIALVLGVVALVFIKVYEKEGFKKALISAILFFKISVLLLVLFGIDTRLFTIYVYRRVGNGMVKIREFPVTAGMVSILSGFVMLLVSLGVHEYVAKQIEKKYVEVVEK